MFKSFRLNYIRFNQKQLRDHIYKGLEDALLRGEIDPSPQGKRVILGSSFTGGARYMLQNYQDAMAICKWAGYPDFFIMFTYNPKWPEICRFVESRGLKTEDFLNILSRIFKIKLDRLIKNLRDKRIFRRVKEVIYTVEFQKQGLPHAHIVFFLHEQNKYPATADIARIISAEIPNELADPHYYRVVQLFMMHGPCGSARTYSPCMQNGRCTKYFPKKFVQSTTIDEDGYPIYRRRKDGRTIKKDSIDLDNRFGILLNRFIGNDHVTASFPQSENEEDSSNVDEINMYYDCRFISSCEVAWRILGFPIHYRQPSVEQLAFYLKDEQNVIFSDDDLIDDVANRPSFLWKRDAKKWKKKETSVFSIGMIFFVPHRSGELYYLRLLLNVIRGLKKINNHEHTTFRDVCYELGLLDDDKEYIDAIKETSDWKMLSYLRQPFAMLLFSNSMSQLEYVWKLTWKLLSEDILQEERAEMTDDELRNHCLQRLENFLKAIGNGNIGISIDGIETIQIPNDLLIKDCVDPISAIIESTYPDLYHYFNELDYLQQRAILAPTLDMVESINDFM
ncbi:uncharacterized protein LOC124894545, partial [Capsicum annuum]|uniref:uncharacterized protein LOC124894545 n=1 Tax=Capsicum annuum TaxID=4072 RepID=UPI001FB0E70F